MFLFLFFFLWVNSIRCHQHGKNCKRTPGRKGRDTSCCAAEIKKIIDLLVAGSACTDFSSYGSNQNQAGPTIAFLLLLMRLVLEYEPELFLHENVILFPLALLEVGRLSALQVCSGRGVSYSRLFWMWISDCRTAQIHPLQSILSCKATCWIKNNIYLYEYINSNKFSWDLLNRPFCT